MISMMFLKLPPKRKFFAFSVSTQTNRTDTPLGFWFNVWCGEGMARMFLPRFRCDYSNGCCQKFPLNESEIKFSFNLVFQVLACNSILFLSFSVSRTHFHRKLLKFECSKTLSNACPALIKLCPASSFESSTLLHSRFYKCWRWTVFP